MKGKYILPYRGTHVKIAKTARINVRGNVSLNVRFMVPLKGQCLIRLLDGAAWDANGNFYMRCCTLMFIRENAHLTTGDNITCNTGTFIDCYKKISIGDYILMGRLVFVSDSDGHPVYNSDGKRINENREIVIEDHVWITNKCTVLKGAHIKTGAVISANSVVSGIVPAHTISVSNPARPVVKDIYWEM